MIHATSVVVRELEAIERGTEAISAAAHDMDLSRADIEDVLIRGIVERADALRAVASDLQEEWDTPSVEVADALKRRVS